MPKGSGKGGNGRDRGEGDSGQNREQENTERSREDKDKTPDGYKPEQSPEGDRPDVSVSVGDLSISGDVYKNTGDGASEIGARTETSYGSAKVVNEMGVQAEHQLSDGKYQLGANAEVKTEGNVGLVGLGANARANGGFHFADGRYQIGAEASANAELKLGNKDETGNELTLGAGVGWGGGGEVIWGADADGDGQKEYGTSVRVKVGIGVDIGFRVEPKAVANRVRDLLGISKGGSEVPREEETHNCAERIHELLSSLEMKRTKEAYARLQSVLGG